MRAVSHLDKISDGSSGPRPKTIILLFPRSADEMNRERAAGAASGRVVLRERPENGLETVTVPNDT
jgi:hypothetical protein